MMTQVTVPVDQQQGHFDAIENSANETAAQSRVAKKALQQVARAQRRALI
jgi:hypothetical protein